MLTVKYRGLGGYILIFYSVFIFYILSYFSISRQTVERAHWIGL